MHIERKDEAVCYWGVRKDSRISSRSCIFSDDIVIVAKDCHCDRRSHPSHSISERALHFESEHFWHYCRDDVVPGGRLAHWSHFGSSSPSSARAVIVYDLVVCVQAPDATGWDQSWLVELVGIEK